MVCPPNLVPALTQTKYYKSQANSFQQTTFLSWNRKLTCWIFPIKGNAPFQWGIWKIGKKRARKLVAINSHVDLFSSAAYLCMQQQTMSTQALSRLLEAVAKSIRHATAMSTILAMEILQARRDVVIDSSKVLLENSCQELQNSPINSKTSFSSRIKEVAKTNFEAQQQKFLATSSAASYNTTAESDIPGPSSH